VTLELSPLDPDAFPAWCVRSAREYAGDLIRQGISPQVAAESVASTMADAFPQGRPTEDNAVFDLRSGADVVGYLWVGRDQSEDPTAWWVWDIVVEPEHRGRGYGRAAMLLAEDYARSRGAATLGLNVFGFNAPARGLYESLGYEATSIKMRKALDS